MNNINNDNQNYIYFPLGGYLTREYLLDRLEKEIKSKLILQKKILFILIYPIVIQKIY